MVALRLHPGRIARIDAAVDAALDCPAFDDAVRRLRLELIDPVDSFGYSRPATSSLQSAAERQAMPELPGSEKLLVSEDKFVRPHIAAACKLASPFSAQGSLRKARPDLRAAARWVSSFAFGSTPAADICASRQRKLGVFGAIRDSLASVDAELDRLSTPQVTALKGPGASRALIAAAMRAAGIPDVHFVHGQVRGFETIGDVKDSGLFRVCERPAALSFTSLAHPRHNEQVASSLRKAATNARTRGTDCGDWRDWERLKCITTKTHAEVASGLMQGPFTSAEVDDKLGAGAWRCLLRFGVEQGFQSDGTTPKVRCCDNAKSSHTNECITSHETIAVEDAAFPMLAASLFAEYLPRLMPLQHSTDDVDSAYRRMAAAHPEATVVAQFNTEANTVSYYTMNGFNFGISSAVLHFNRHSQNMSMLARRFFGVCNAAFFDDYDITEPTYTGASGKQVLRQLHVWLGMPLATGDKDVAAAASNPFLGVVSDLNRFALGEAFMRSKPSRIAKLLLAIEHFLDTREAPPDPLSLFGKLEFTASSAGYHRLGRAALSTLREWHQESRRRGVSSDGTLPVEVLEALKFFHAVLPILPARRFTFGASASTLPPIIVYTDAMYEPGSAVPARIGIAIYDPADPDLAPSRGEEPSLWRHCSASVPADLIAKLRPRKQQIGPLETLGALVCYLSRPEQFRNRQVIHFIDNTGALFSMAKGYTKVVDAARMVHVFHSLCAAVNAQVWFEFVPSGANLADQPSRGELELLSELGSTAFMARWPDMDASWEKAFVQIFNEFGAKPTKAEKRARRTVEDAVSADRAKRARV